jgi:hypothetical protein
MSVEPGCQKFEESNWNIITEFLATDELERRFNTKIEPTDVTRDDMLHIPMLVERDIAVETKERAALHQMYEKPTKKHPEGRIVYSCNNKTLDVQPLPGGERRIVHFRGIVLPGEFWPTSMVSQVIPLQMELNRGRSQLIENRNLCTRPQLRAVEGSIKPGSYKSKPGHVMFWDHIISGGIAPDYLPPPQVPGWVLNILGQVNQDIMDLSSRHEASQGAANPEVTSGKQAAIFRSADDSRLAPQVRQFESGLQMLGKYMLAETQENLDGHYIVPIVGKGRETEVARFQATDVSCSHNIKYEIASQLPWARESMRQTIMYLNSIGKVDDETMFDMLEMPSVQRLYENQTDHRLNARKENDFLSQAYVPPLPTDNHKVHLAEHERLINSPEFRDQFMEEMRQEQEKQQLIAQQAQMMGQQPPDQKKTTLPPSIQNYMRHMEEHRKSIPAQQPPPPATKINLNLDRVLQNPVVANNPDLLRQLLPLVMDLVKDSAGEAPTASNMAGPGGKPRAPAGKVGAAPGAGLSGELYGTGSSASAGMNPEDVGLIT